VLEGTAVAAVEGDLRRLHVAELLADQQRAPGVDRACVGELVAGVDDGPVGARGDVAVAHHHQVGAAKLLDQVDDVVDGGLGRSPEGHRARGPAAPVEPERDREAELQAARHPPPGSHDAVERLEVGDERGLLVVEEAWERVRLDVELDPAEAFLGGDAGVVVGDELDELRPQVAQRLLGPGGAAADRVHGQPKA
jgi:hypothetical protein